MNIDSSIWLDKNQKGFLGKGRIELLKNIDKYGSLSKAAKEMKMSYKAAWDSLNEMKNLSSTELIISSSGGSGGGGSKLTAQALEYIKIYELLFQTQQKFLKTIESHTNNSLDLKTFLRRSSLRTSARNQIFGKVISIQKDSISSTLNILIDKNLHINSTITNKSIKELDIKKGKDIYVLIKAPWVKISSTNTQENQINCIIKSIKKEKNLVELTLHVSPSLTLISVMDLNQFNLLHVSKNENTTASFNANDTIIGI
jgi:molybdate transport system regulatory protein